jgi:hypothetical protein
VLRPCSSTRADGRPLGRRRVRTDALDTSVTHPCSSTRGDGRPLGR